MRPLAPIPAGPLPTRLGPALWLYIRPYWGGLLAMQICAMAWGIDTLLGSYLVANIVDQINAAGADKDAAYNAILPWIIWFFFFWILCEVGYRGAGFIGARVMPRLEATARMDLFQRVHQFDYAFLIDHLAGDISTKVNDFVRSMASLVGLVVWHVTNAVLSIGLGLILLSGIHPLFLWSLAGMAVTFIGITLLVAKRLSRINIAYAEARSQLTGRIVDSITNFLPVRSFVLRRTELGTIGGYQDTERHLHNRQIFNIEMLRMGYAFASLLFGGILMMGGGFYGWYHGWVTAGDIVLLFGASGAIIQRLWYLCDQIPEIMKHTGTVQQAIKLLSTLPRVTDKPDATELQFKQGGITFDAATFGYRTDNPLFNGLTLDIAPGQKVGLVGYSGSGKTSFVRLIMRLFNLSAGSIKIDGQDIAGVTQDSLRRAISFIPQDPELFHRTIRENIVVGKPQATEAEVAEAVRLAHADGFIKALPQGLDSIVGERGVKLSGGQRQRIALARVAIRNAPILILDEATSALDSVTEVAVQDSLKHLMEGRTTIVIAHRLSTLMNMDRILVFDKGKIVEDGTARELIAKGGVFKTLWDAQVGGFLQDKPGETL